MRRAVTIALIPLALAGCLFTPPAELDLAPSDAGTFVDAGPADAGPNVGAVRVATFNVHRFFDTVCQSGNCGGPAYEELPTQAEFDAKADQLSTAIRGFSAQVVVLQEVETQACLDALESRLADVLPSAVLGEIGTPASVDVAVLAAAPITQVVTHRDQVLTRPDGSTTRFSREFLEVHLATTPAPTIVFAAHFRSKVNDDPGRRLAEAQAARDIMKAVAAAHPEALVVLGGDLNDTPGSPPIDALEGGGLVRVAADVPLSDQWTYDYYGDEQAIDHLFLAPGGRGQYVAASAHALREATRGYAGSDHDPLLADFRLGP